jgi:hypothetical protein
MRTAGLILICLYLIGSSISVLYLAWTMWQSGTTFLSLGQMLVPLIRSESFVSMTLLTYLNSIYSFAAQSLILAILACGLWFRHAWALWGTIAFQIFVLSTHFFVFALRAYHIGLQGSNPWSLKIIVAVAMLIYLLRPKIRGAFGKQLKLSPSS